MLVTKEADMGTKRQKAKASEAAVRPAEENERLQRRATGEVDWVAGELFQDQ
jgi:hypothetical protein